VIGDTAAAISTTFRGILLAAALALVIMHTAPLVNAAGVRDLADGWLATPRELGQVLYPATPVSDEHRWRWRADLGTGRLYGMPELPLRAAGLTGLWCRRSVTWQLAGSWQITGGDLFRTDSWLVVLGRSGKWRSGLRLLRERTLLAGGEGPRHAETDLVLGRAWGAMTADLYVPVDAPPPPGGRRLRPVARIAVVGAGGTVVLECDRRGGDELLLGLELGMGLGAALVLLRYDGASGSMGPGLALTIHGLLLRTSHLLHPALGISHRVQMVVGPGLR